MNFFKKKAGQIATQIKQAVETPKDPNVIVAEIHEAFDTASEKLLNEAKNILAGSYDIEKGERLKKAGFVRAKKAVEATTVVNEKSNMKRVAELIGYYQMNYPNNKFITESKVQEICKKYGLLCGETRYYISDVPEKNLSEIESFSLKDEDCNKISYSWYKRDTTHNYWHYIGKKGEGCVYGYTTSSGGWNNFTYIHDESKECHYEKPDFLICASVKDFDTKNMRIEDGYKLQQNIPDPIVLQPVRGGYLVVTKWGLEGKDESLVNEKQN